MPNSRKTNTPAIARLLGALCLASLTLFFVSACQWAQDGWDAVWECGIKSEMNRNAANLAKLRVGMSKEEVRKIMGEPVAGCYEKPNVWYYYLRPRWQDFAVTRDECAPVVFDDDGFLVGWGSEYYKANYEFSTWAAMRN